MMKLNAKPETVFVPVRASRNGRKRLCACGTPVIPGDWSCYSCAAS